MLGYYAVSGDMFAPVYADGPDMDHAVDLETWQDLVAEGRRETLLVSACLGTMSTRYDGTNRYEPRIEELSQHYDLVFVCPEMLGGLPTPRTPAETIPGYSGDDVLDSTASVVTKDGTDVTNEYLGGADRSLGIANAVGARKALMMERSPSCGVYTIYDGTYAGTLKEGRGVATALLNRDGIDVYAVDEIDMLLELAEGSA